MDTPPATVPPEKLLARAAAAIALTAAAGEGSATLDRLATWFLAGVGAAIALLLSNLDSLQGHLSADAVVCAGQLFLVSAVLCVIQRYISGGITSGAKAAKQLENMGDKFPQIDIQEFFAQLVAAYPWPIRKLVEGQFAAIIAGDLAVAGRMFVRLSLLQGVFVFFEMVLLMFSVGRVIGDIRV